MVLAEPIRVILEVTAALEELGLRYLVGGSVASSLHGVPRSTADADLVVEMGAEHAEPLASRLEADFYVDAGMIRDAVAHRSCFNVIYLSSMYKVDIFVSTGDAFHLEELERAEVRSLGGRAVRIATAEDIVVEKLRWYRLGQQVSERQWRDALGVLSVKGAALDLEYMRRWSRVLGVEDLLEGALAEVGPPGAGEA